MSSRSATASCRKPRRQLLVAAIVGPGTQGLQLCTLPSMLFAERLGPSRPQRKIVSEEGQNQRLLVGEVSQEHRLKLGDEAAKGLMRGLLVARPSASVGHSHHQEPAQHPVLREHDLPSYPGQAFLVRFVSSDLIGGHFFSPPLLEENAWDIPTTRQQ